MKIRRGLVSNSSSSSFLLLLDYIPQTVEETQKLLFVEEEFFPHPYEELEYKTSEIAEVVFEDIQKAKPLSKDEVKRQLKRGPLHNEEVEVEYDEIFFRSLELKSLAQETKNKEEKNHLYKQSEDLLSHFDKTIRQPVYKKLLEKAKSAKYVICIEYSDDNSLGNALEHGNVFKRIPHVKISHH